MNKHLKIREKFSVLALGKLFPVELYRSNMKCIEF